MGILDQYKKALEEEEKDNMNFPSDTNLTEKDKDAYEEALRRMRDGSFSEKEVSEAINNSKRNMSSLGDRHHGVINEENIKVQQHLVRITDEELRGKELISFDEISDIRVVRAYCPKCGKELIAKAPVMYNPFTFEKVCIHECCGERYNLDKTYPHIAFYDNNGNEISSFF